MLASEENFTDCMLRLYLLSGNCSLIVCMWCIVNYADNMHVMMLQVCRLVPTQLFNIARSFLDATLKSWEGGTEGEADKYI